MNGGKEVRRRFYSALEKLTGAPVPKKQPAFLEIVDEIVLAEGKFLLSQEALNRVLLCCDRNVVTPSFFEYFFKSALIRDVGQLEEGVESFRKRQC